MSAAYRELEDRIERRLSPWRAALDVAPPIGVTERVRAAVAAEARRLQQRELAERRWQPALAAAAAIALAMTLAGPRFQAGTWQAPVLVVKADPEVLLNEWSEALEESGEHFTRLLNDPFGWADWSADDPAAAEDALSGLEESLHVFEDLSGA